MSWNFATADGDNPRNSKGDVITPVLNWLNADYSEINSAEPTNGEPYMITGITVALSDGDESENFILPDGKTEIAFPIHIRNSAKAELYLDTPVDPTYYQISAYCPQDASGDFVLLYRYCGENMPTASQLDAAQDFATDSSFIEDYSDDCFGVWGLPDGEGWYAFYAQMGDYISDYLLIDSRDTTACGHVDGSRDGDKNGSFPDIEQDAPTVDDSDDSDDDYYDDSDYSDDYEQEDESAEGSGGGSVVSTIVVDPPAPVEYESANGMAVSGVRIETFAQIG
ncbi:MAG: hypothetical protein J5968_01015 [Oscillospiraceae bacterium]|nr:hypothetical protein [Oscillospiraceae bacterium]